MRRGVLAACAGLIVILLIVLFVLRQAGSTVPPSSPDAPPSTMAPSPLPSSSSSPEVDMVQEQGTIKCLNGKSIAGIWIDSDDDYTTGQVEDLGGEIEETGTATADFDFMAPRGVGYVVSVGCGVDPDNEDEWDPDGEFQAVDSVTAKGTQAHTFTCGVFKDEPTEGCRVTKAKR